MTKQNQGFSGRGARLGQLSNFFEKNLKFKIKADKKPQQMDKVREITLQRHPVKDFGLQPGDAVRVSLHIKEGGRERTQVFEGNVLKVQGSAGHSRSFTVRKISDGVGVEKTIPLATPKLSHVEILSRAKVRRARLFYLRKRKGRAARLSRKIQKPSPGLADKKSSLPS